MVNFIERFWKVEVDYISIGIFVQFVQDKIILFLKLTQARSSTSEAMLFWIEKVIFFHMFDNGRSENFFKDFDSFFQLSVFFFYSLDFFAAWRIHFKQ